MTDPHPVPLFTALDAGDEVAVVAALTEGSADDTLYVDFTQGLASSADFARHLLTLARRPDFPPQRGDRQSSPLTSRPAPVQLLAERHQGRTLHVHRLNTAQSITASEHDRGCLDSFHHGMGSSVGITLTTRNKRLAMFTMGDARFGFSSRSRRHRREASCAWSSLCSGRRS